MKDEIYIGGWTLPRLREKSQTERHEVWKRARALHSAEGNHLARAIERLGLPYAEPEALDGDTPCSIACARSSLLNRSPLGGDRGDPGWTAGDGGRGRAAAREAG